jgi:AcrR family transcriptional regulator
VVLPLLDAPAEPDGSSLGLRERKKQQARAAIADAALELFADRGYDGTTVADVAARAGVSPATVARYFPSKESLLFSDLDTKAPALQAAIAERPAAESPFTAVVNALAARAHHPDPEHDRRLLRSRQAIARSPVLRGHAAALMGTWRDAIAEAARGRGASTEDAHVLATVVVAVLDDAADRWGRSDGREPLADLVADAFQSLSRTHRRIP